MSRKSQTPSTLACLDPYAACWVPALYDDTGRSNADSFIHPRLVMYVLCSHVLRACARSCFQFSRLLALHEFQVSPRRPSTPPGLLVEFYLVVFATEAVIKIGLFLSSGFGLGALDASISAEMAKDYDSEENSDAREEPPAA